MRIAEVQPAPVPAPAETARDSREAFIPGDPLGARFGGDSIASTVEQGDRLATLSRTSSGSLAPAADEQESHGGMTISVLLIVAGLVLLGIQLYRRRGRFNFAGQGNNR